MNSVIVYLDGTVGLRDLPNQPTFRMVKLPPMSNTFDVVELTKPVVLLTDDFERVGRMFDGRPIFVPVGWELKVLRVEQTYSLSQIRHMREPETQIDADLRGLARPFITPEMVKLDQRTKEHQNLSLHLVSFQRQHLVAAPKAA